MKLECLTLRDGTTPVQIGKTGHPYMFQERRDALCPQEGPTTSVFDVSSQEHVDHLLRFPNFRIFDPKVPPPAQNPVLDMGNYHIEKFIYGKEEGYICVQKAPRRYAGRDGDWKENTKDMMAFQNEMSAYEWLFDEVKAHQADNKDAEEDAGLTAQVAQLLNGGVPQNDIATKLNVSKGTVSKHKTKAVALGLVKEQ